MLKTLKNLKYAFSSPKGVSNISPNRVEGRRKIVSKVSAGNVSLQRGRYITSKDIELKREKVLSL